ncbi:MAG: T9SS type A sorting domain-containing protein [Bacteroidales bacterium]|jgi:hypothetical protein|nr:T9SS type A sorting domain-containing protein [Bacteroidales bacterium]
MKTLISTLFVLVSLLAFGQNPYQIADSTKKWSTVKHAMLPMGIIACDGTKTTKFQEEVIINNTTYFRVFEAQDSLQQNWSHIGYLTEDTLSKKVYYAGWNAEAIGLIYDFGLSVGDSVVVDNYYAGYENLLMVCEGIDSVNINGMYKKAFFLRAPYYGTYDSWIEGVGSRFGILYSGYNAPGGGTDLLCCSKNDTVIYMNPNYNACYYQDFYPQIVSESFDTAYLNSFYEFQLQISNTINIDSFAFIGNLIPEGFELDETTGLLTGMPLELGSFPCVITVENYDLGFLADIIDAEIHVVMPTGISDEPKQSLLKIHPNPFSASFLISFEKAPKEVYYLEIYNYEGKIIDKRTFTENQSEIDCSAFKDGIYLLKITDSNQQIIGIEKVMKK